MYVRMYELSSTQCLLKEALCFTKWMNKISKKKYIVSEQAEQNEIMGESSFIRIHLKKSSQSLTSQTARSLRPAHITSTLDNSDIKTLVQDIHYDMKCEERPVLFSEAYGPITQLFKINTKQ